MADPRDTEHRDGAAEEDTELPLSEKERRILELYDQVLKLEVELALTKARQEVTIGTQLTHCGRELPGPILMQR